MYNQPHWFAGIYVKRNSKTGSLAVFAAAMVMTTFEIPNVNVRLFSTPRPPLAAGLSHRSSATRQGSRVTSHPAVGNCTFIRTKVSHLNVCVNLVGFCTQYHPKVSSSDRHGISSSTSQALQSDSVAVGPSSGELENDRRNVDTRSLWYRFHHHR